MSQIYSSSAHLLTYLPPDVTNSTNDTERQSALEAASALADSYLAQRYQLPLVSYGADLQRYVCLVSAYDLAVSKNLATENGRDSHLYLRQQEAIKWLAEVAQGKISPNLTPSTVSSDAESAGSGATPVVITATKRGW